MKRYVNVFLFHAASKHDQPQRRELNSFAGGNSAFGLMFSWSVNFRDLIKNIVSCNECVDTLSNGVGTHECDRRYNWNINHKNIEHSEETKGKKIFQHTITFVH